MQSTFKMNKQLKTFFIFCGIWFIAALLNGILSGSCIIILGSEKFFGGDSTFGLAMICSFIFSVPLVGLVWLVTCIAIASGKKGFALFQIILATALILGIAGALFFINGLGNDFKESRYAVGGCIIFSALSAVLFFRNQLKRDV